MSGGRVSISQDGKDLVLPITGVLDERLRLRELGANFAGQAKKADRLLIDLGGVIQLNSVGVRDWLLFLTQAQELLPACEFTRVSEAVILQAAILPSMLGNPGTPVRGFEVPYHCPKCRVRVVFNLTPKDMGAAQGYLPPPRSCEDCGTAMELDSLEQDYLQFLSRSGG